MHMHMPMLSAVVVAMTVRVAGLARYARSAIVQESKAWHASFAAWNPSGFIRSEATVQKVELKAWTITSSRVCPRRLVSWWMRA